MVREAEAVLDGYTEDPKTCMADARRMLRRPGLAPEARVVAGHALALARFELGELGPAIATARRCLAIAATHSIDRRAGQVRLTLAHLESERGRTSVAMALVDEAMPALRGRDVARGRARRGILLARSGQLADAVAVLRSALPLLRRGGDRHWEALALGARGLALAYLGQLAAADTDLARAAELFTALDEPLRAGGQVHNRGFVALRGGDIPRALQLFDEATLAGYSVERFPEVWVDRAEALMSAGLVGDARALLAQCLSIVDNSMRRTTLAETLLVFSYAAMRQRDIDAAQEAAQRAEKLFRRQRRLAWVPLARYVLIRTRWITGERTVALRRDAQTTAGRLERHGWALPGQGLRLIAARIALHLGERTRADALLAQLAGSRHRGPADLRAPAWYAEAVRRHAHGDRRGTLAALDAGMRVVDEHAAAFGATELQAHAAALSRDLATMAVQVGMSRGSARDILRWTERYRAGALVRPSVRPPADPALADALVRLRAAAAETRAPGHSVLSSQRRATLEAEVRRLTLHSRGVAHRRDRVEPGQLTRLLGEAALVSYFRLADQLHALTLAEGRLRHHELGSFTEAGEETELLRACLHRMARQPDRRGPARQGLDYTAARLTALLVEPLLSRIGQRPLVVVPTGVLHALPWSVLPELAGRHLTVAPSAAAWRDAVLRNEPRVDGAHVLVAGPGLRHADAELRAVAPYAGPRPLVLSGPAATADTVLAALDGAELAHVASHGRFRSDNPQFSHLDLADGPLYVYDLERLTRGPRRLVLSACDTGLSGVRPGDELVGVTAAVLGQGTSTLIASVVPVPDDAAVPLMEELHARLAGGMGPAAALLAAQRVHGLLGFGCFGAG